MANWAIWNRNRVLANALEDWRERGLLDAQTVSNLEADIAENTTTRSFTTVVVLLGVICLAFGVMTFVAANWEAMSNLARVALLFVALWASWGISVWLKARGNEWAAQAFVLLACAIFGASIMLIGQIYHIQGKPKDATWLWAMGTIFGALLTRSAPALGLGALLITLWALMGLGLFSSNNRIEYTYLAYWLICAAGAWWLSSRMVAHLLAAGMCIWLFVSAAQYLDVRGGPDDLLFVLVVLFSAYLLVSVSLYSYGKGIWLKGYEPTAIAYGMILVGGMSFLWYMATDQRYNGDWRLVATHYWPGIVASLVTIALAAMAHRQHHPWRYDMLVAAIFTIIASGLSGFIHRVPFLMEAWLLALSIWTIRMGWRLEYRALSTLGFLGFSGVMLLLYFETLGSLLDTSLFYLGAGVLLLLGAVVIPRFMRRRGLANSGEGAS